MKKLLVLLLFLTQLTTAAWADRPIEVLITGTRIRSGAPYLDTYMQACAAEGVNVHFSLKPPGMDFTAIPLEEMKKYDVIVYHGVPVANSSCVGTAQDAQTFRDNLEKFRQLGGGLLWMPTPIINEVDDWNGSVGPQFGLTISRDRLWDPKNIVSAAPVGSPLRVKFWYNYNWTTAITPHPVTEGVRGLLLPIQGDWSFPAVVPFTCGPGWQVLIRGMPTMRTIPPAEKYSGGALKFNENGKGIYDTSPPVVAVKDGEGTAGRMMIMPIVDSYTFQNFGSPLLFDAFMKNGAEGHLSDGHRLLLNAFKWLAQPAVARGLGTLVETKSKGPPPVDESPIDWHTERPLEIGSITGTAADGHLFKGLFGARTAGGGGAGTVAEYVAAAKKAGLSFLVFMDDATKMKDDAYQKLLADCKANTDDSFLAIPGYSITDEWGNDYFMTDEAHVPDPTFLNQDGKLVNYWGMDKQSRTNWGSCLWRLGHWPVHPWYAAKFHIMAPYTYEGNKLVDDGLARYREVQGVPQNCSGVSVSILTSPDQVPGAVKDTHLTVIQAADLAETRNDIDEDHSLPTGGIRPFYITNGPVIERWAVRQARRLDYHPGGDRMQLELKVKSDAGLQDVSIIECNTGAIYRDFRPQGQHEFSCTIDEANTRQFYLLPKITDVNGRTAIGSVVWTIQPGSRIGQMGDRLMSVTLSEVYDSTQGKTVQQGNSLGLTWTKGKSSAGDLRVMVDENGSRVWGFDGGSIAVGELSERRKVTTTDGAEPIIPNASRQTNNLGSYDAGIVDFTENMQYVKENMLHVAIIPGVPIPTTIADLFIRNVGLRITPNSPTVARMREITIHFKKDTIFKNFDILNLMRQYPKDPPLWFIKDTAGEVNKKLASGEKFSRAGTLGAGDYICPSNEVGGPVAIINLGPQEIQYKASYGQADLYIDGKNRPVKAGDTVVVRFLALGRNREMQDDPGWLKDYVTQYGVDGSKPAYDPVVTQGQLVSSAYFLNLKAVDGGATFTSKKADLPNRVLVRLDGLPEHGVYGRYDLDLKQLRLVPWYDGGVYTSIKPAKTANHLYVGEIFHCDDPAIILSAVQDGADNLLVEIHNPTDKARTVALSGVPGFAPLADLKESVTVGPFQSVKRAWKTPAGSLIYQGIDED